MNTTGTTGAEAPKIYRIKVLHAGPKSSHTATETFIVAASDAAVADYINATYRYGCWFDCEDDELRTRYTEESGEIPFKDWVIANRGDINDEEGWDNSYYGVTKWGWEQIQGATQEDIATLIRLGLIATPTESEVAK